MSCVVHVCGLLLRYLYLGMEAAEKLVNAALEQLLTAGSSSSSTRYGSSSSSNWLYRIATATWRSMSNPGASSIGDFPGSARLLLQGFRRGGCKTTPVHTMRSHQRTAAAAAAGSAELKLSQCPLLNISICLPSVAATSTFSTAQKLALGTVLGAKSSSSGGSSSLLVVAYNSLAWPREEFVRVPVGAQQRYQVTGESVITFLNTKTTPQTCWMLHPAP